MQKEALMFFSLGLPTGPIYWFGITNMQMVTSEKLTLASGFLSFIPYLSFLLPIIFLAGFGLYIKNKEHRRLFLEGFAISTIIQPFFFVLIFILGGGHLFSSVVG